MYFIYIMKEKILKLNDIKNTNLQMVLKILLESDGLSRIELAQKMGCDNTTVSRAVRELIARGIVVQGDKNELEHGRPRIRLQLNPDGPAVVGISLEAERINGVVTDLRGKILEQEQVIFCGIPDRKQFLDSVARIIHSMNKKAGERCAGMGVAVFGNYRGTDFKLENAAALPSLNGLELRPFLNRVAQCEVTVCDHLVAKMAFLTRMFPEFNSGSVMLISSGSGIGSLIAEKGRFLFVRNNHSGEFGHCISVPDGILCGCGRRGCLETVATIRALLHSCRSKLEKPDLTFEEICRLFQNSDPVVTDEVKSVANHLGIAISNHLNSYPMDRLIITGRILELGPEFQNILEEKIKSIVFSSVQSGLSIHFIRLDYDNALARGAAIFSERLSGIIPS